MIILTKVSPNLADILEILKLYTHLSINLSYCPYLVKFINHKQKTRYFAILWQPVRSEFVLDPILITKKYKISWFHVSLLAILDTFLGMPYTGGSMTERALSQNLPISTTEKLRVAHSNYWLAWYHFLLTFGNGLRFNVWLKRSKETIRSFVLKILITLSSNHKGLWVTLPLFPSYIRVKGNKRCIICETPK